MSDKAHGPFFRRAVPPDRGAHLAEIERRRGVLAAARASGDVAATGEAAGNVGWLLFWIEGSEGEAAALLEEALAAARVRRNRAAEITWLLGLGTALQYLGERERSVALFEEGLALCEATGIREQEHFLLHHLGRCLVEMGRIDEAKKAFEKALAIRVTLPNTRFADSTRAALADTAKM
ncbi:MAG: tetratricopeptide repeat protein [Reyranella sp.]|nr:tetratricopeptide repeat protein [Reyranella sp.]